MRFVLRLFRTRFWLTKNNYNAFLHPDYVKPDKSRCRSKMGVGRITGSGSSSFQQSERFRWVIIMLSAEKGQFQCFSSFKLPTLIISGPTAKTGFFRLDLDKICTYKKSADCFKPCCRSVKHLIYLWKLKTSSVRNFDSQTNFSLTRWVVWTPINIKLYTNRLKSTDHKLTLYKLWNIWQMVRFQSVLTWHK